MKCAAGKPSPEASCPQSALPAVIAYKMNAVTNWLARRIARTRFVNLVNIILDRPVVPELLLEECTPDRLSSALAHLLTDAAAPPPKPRRPTRPSRAARERRLADKQRRSEIKRLRRPGAE